MIQSHDNGATIEREIKFRLPRAGSAASIREAVESAGFRLEPTGVRVHEDRYLDTEDWALYRAGIALRIRAGEDGARLEAKTVPASSRKGDANGTLERMEWSQPAPEADPPWTSLDSGPVEALLRPLTGLRVLDRLQVRARVRNDRECFRWMRGETRLGSLTIDHVTAPPSTFEEAELELENGAEDALREARRAVENRLGIARSLETKLAAALTAAGGSLPTRDERAYAVHPADRLLDVAHKTLGRHFARLLWHEPGVRVGMDPESVHDMRVASRRLRAALDVLADGIPEAPREELARNLRWVGRALGRVRDLDVAIGRVRALAEEGPALEGPALEGPALAVFAQSLEIRRAERRLRLIARLDSERFADFVVGARAWLEAGPWQTDMVPAGLAPAYAVGQGIVSRFLETMREAYEKAEQSLATEDLHALRIAAKRARYAIEFFGEAEGPAALRRAKRIAALQDLLGDQRDLEALGRRFRRYARTIPKKDRELLLSAGSAIGHLERASRPRRAELHVVWERVMEE
jgi:triphosphatase